MERQLKRRFLWGCWNIYEDGSWGLRVSIYYLNGGTYYKLSIYTFRIYYSKCWYIGIKVHFTGQSTLFIFVQRRFSGDIKRRCGGDRFTLSMKVWGDICILFTKPMKMCYTVHLLVIFFAKSVKSMKALALDKLG